MTPRTAASRRIVTRLLQCAVLSGCLALSAAAAAEDAVIHDARGRDVAIGHPTRIVSIGGAVTEILYALGAEDRIVAIDTTSLYPRQAMTDKPNVGYMRQLSAEGVLGLNPQMVLAIAGSGPKETIEVIDAAKIPLIMVPDSFSETGIIDKIRMVAKVTGLGARGECLASSVESDLAGLRELRDRVKAPVRVMFVMSFVDGRAMVSGQKTAASEIIKLSGGINAVEGFDGYKIMNDEAIAAARPDVILSMERGKDSVQSVAIFASPAFALTPAAKSKSFVAMDGLYLLGFGPRTAAAAHDLALTIHPALAKDAAVVQATSSTVNCRQ
jgi:iron complex transport system substrate-binding protein